VFQWFKGALKMKRLNHLILALAALTLGAGAANARTYLSKCGAVIATPGEYDLTNNVSTSSSSTPCIEITGLTGGTVTLKCNNYTVMNTLTTPPMALLYVHHNAAGSLVSWTGCPFTAPNAGQSSPGWGNVLVKDTPIDVEGPGNSYTNVVVLIQCSTTGFGSPVVTLNNATVINATIQVTGCLPTISGNTLGNFTLANAPYLGAPILVAGSSLFTISNNTITGVQDGSGNNKMDDGINLDWDGTNTPADGTVSGNTITNFYDLCIEFIGPFRNTTVTNNACYNTTEGILGGYYYTSQDHLDVENNSLNINGGGSSSTFIFSTYATSFSSFFTNNHFYNNTVTGSTGGNTGSLFGWNGTGTTPIHFAAYSGNAFGSNNLGALVVFDADSGVTDHGRNTCGSTSRPGTLSCR
jgi:hypothetical protein